ncbi:MAG: uncharacterized protein KVP18_001467 [Porospora cf. gigantea A]|uniref:uncharacterized protein n=1 Tax=Porospora cf. gigantea A TaxID=2853593 RepID=UPI00355A56F8|nr:MAG: hypothetical protein KVP18_001467 [Porospora cf. gigantea A]
MIISLDGYQSKIPYLFDIIAGSLGTAAVPSMSLETADSLSSPSLALPCVEQAPIERPLSSLVERKDGTSETYDESPLQSLWEGVYRSEDVHRALYALVPPKEMLEFYHEGVPLSIKQKSFLFACAVGLGPMAQDKTTETSQLRLLWPLSRGRHRTRFSPSVLERLSAFHMLDLVDSEHMTCEVPRVLKAISKSDRLQYLRESTSFAAVALLEAARWTFLDASSEAVNCTLPQLTTTLLVDMSMLLLPWQSHTPLNIPVTTVILCLTLIFLSLESETEAETRQIYFLIQQTFQAFRCWRLGHSPRGHIPLEKLLSMISAEPLRVVKGWTRLTAGWRPCDFSGTIDVVTLKRLGLWPVALNPFKLSGRKWADVADLPPYKTQKGAMILDALPFVLNEELCAWELDVAVREKPLRRLETYVANQYLQLPASLRFRHLIIKDKMVEIDALFPQDGDLTKRLGSVCQWITTPADPSTFLGQVPWPVDDKWRAGLRAKIAVDVLACVCTTSNRSYQLSVAVCQYLRSLPQTLLTRLTTSSNMCFCQLRAYSVPDDMAERLARYTDPTRQEPFAEANLSLVDGVPMPEHSKSTKPRRSRNPKPHSHSSTVERLRKVVKKRDLKETIFSETLPNTSEWQLYGLAQLPDPALTEPHAIHTPDSDMKPTKKSKQVKKTKPKPFKAVQQQYKMPAQPAEVSFERTETFDAAEAALLMVDISRWLVPTSTAALISSKIRLGALVVVSQS